jgi:hypothetical protein
MPEAIEVKIQSDPKGWKDNVKFGMEIAGPLVATIFGVLILRLTKKLEQTQWRSQKIIEKRIIEWDEIRKKLNDIFCYCVRVGAWKSMTPLDVIACKRECDRLVHLARPYFSPHFFTDYLHFIRTCFEHYQGHTVDAKIKSPLWEHQNAHTQQWDPSWDALFFDSPSSEAELWRAYENMLARVSEELQTRHK